MTRPVQNQSMGDGESVSRTMDVGISLRRGTARRTLFLAAVSVVVLWNVFLDVKVSRALLVPETISHHEMEHANADSLRNANRTSDEMLSSSTVTTTWAPSVPQDGANNITVAYAISVTSCQSKATTIFDSAAVLRNSIRLAANHSTKYGFRMVAFLHPDASECADKLKWIGYDVQIRHTPMNVAELQNQQLRRVVHGGCCGIKEFMKLYSYTLHEYPIVMHCDLDVILLKPLDHLFDAMLDPSPQPPLFSSLPFSSNTRDDKATVQPMWPSANASSLPRKIDFLFTRDYNSVDPPHRKPHQVGVQGGFLILKPNQTDFDLMIRLIKLGGNFTQRHGWGGKEHQYGGYYGAATIQGFLPYYYGLFASERALELNRCTYNNMVDEPRHPESNVCRTLEKDCEDCQQKSIAEIYTAHFTICQKPWECMLNQHIPLCIQLHRAWHSIRHDLEHGWTQGSVDEYQAKQHRSTNQTNRHHNNSNSDDGDDEMVKIRSWTHGNCARREDYIPIVFPPSFHGAE